MPGASYTFQFPGLKQGAADVEALRRSIKGLATDIPPSLLGGKAGPSHVLQSPRLLQQGAAQLLAMGSIVSPGPISKTIQSQFNQALGIGMGQMRMTGQARSAYQSMWQSLVPPMIGARPGINWRQAGIGAMVSPFSPWLGARNLSSAFGGFMGGGGGGGIGSAIFGASGPGGMAVWFTAIRTAAMALEGAFRELHDAVKQGAKLYQDSARTGISTGKTFHLQSIGNAIGLTSAQIETLLVRGEHPLKGGGATMNQRDVGAIFGAGRGTQQIALLQQMGNMSDYIARAWQATALAALEMSNVAKPLQETQYRLAMLAVEWKTMWAEIATVISPVINEIFREMEIGLKVINFQLLQWVEIMKALHLIPQGEPGSKVISAGRAGGGYRSSFERMGFVMGGASGGSSDYARRTAVAVEKLVNIATGKTQTGATSETFGMHAAINLP